MLLRVCYIDVPGFFALARRDKGQCQSLMKTAFKKGFKLRRKGHTGRPHSATKSRQRPLGIEVPLVVMAW